MKELIPSDKLDFWIEKKRNVLFIGDPGVGKTSAAISAFQRNNLKYMYFSCSTLDPFIDLVGVPRVVHIDGKDVLKLVQQDYLSDDSIEAFIFDEYNRAPKKVRNAVMELIQFKSINGRVFPNLKVIWACINEGEEFDTEMLDSAQKDRFHVHFDVPYKPCAVYMNKQYGENIGRKACEWWFKLNEDMKKLVSPRRLTYALDYWLEDGDIREILPNDKNLNISRFLELLNEEPIEDVLARLHKESKPLDMKKFFNDENNFLKSKELVYKNPEYVDLFIPQLNNEKLSSLLGDSVIFDHVMRNMSSVPHYDGIIKSLIKTNANVQIADKVKKYMIKNNLIDESTQKDLDKQVVKTSPLYSKTSKQSFPDMLDGIVSGYDINSLTFAQRKAIWSTIITNVPQKMDEDDAIDFAKIIVAVVNMKSSTYPWKEYPDFVGVINTLTRNLYSYGHQPGEIKTILPFYHLMQDSEVENDLFIPPATFTPRPASERFKKVSASQVAPKFSPGITPKKAVPNKNNFPIQYEDQHETDDDGW